MRGEVGILGRTSGAEGDEVPLPTVPMTEKAVVSNAVSGTKLTVGVEEEARALKGCSRRSLISISSMSESSDDMTGKTFALFFLS